MINLSKFDPLIYKNEKKEKVVEALRDRFQVNREIVSRVVDMLGEHLDIIQSLTEANDELYDMVRDDILDDDLLEVAKYIRLINVRICQEKMHMGHLYVQLFSYPFAELFETYDASYNNLLDQWKNEDAAGVVRNEETIKANEILSKSHKMFPFDEICGNKAMYDKGVDTLKRLRAKNV